MSGNREMLIDIVLFIFLQHMQETGIEITLEETWACSIFCRSLEARAFLTGSGSKLLAGTANDNEGEITVIMTAKPLCNAGFSR